MKQLTVHFGSKKTEFLDKSSNQSEDLYYLTLFLISSFFPPSHAIPASWGAKSFALKSISRDSERWMEVILGNRE